MTSTAARLSWGTLQEERRNTWYPTIIGDAGDRWCGQRARLYYGSMTSEGFHDRKFMGRDIAFFRQGEPGMLLTTHAFFPMCLGSPWMCLHID